MRPALQILRRTITCDVIHFQAEDDAVESEAVPGDMNSVGNMIAHLVTIQRDSKAALILTARVPHSQDGPASGTVSLKIVKAAVLLANDACSELEPLWEAAMLDIDTIVAGNRNGTIKLGFEVRLLSLRSRVRLSVCSAIRWLILPLIALRPAVGKNFSPAYFT